MSKVFSKVPSDHDSPKQESVDIDDIYDCLERFLNASIPVKGGGKLEVVCGLSNRTVIPTPPFIMIQLIDEEQLAFNESRYTSTHKVVHDFNKVTLQIDFYGKDNIKAHKMAKSFLIRFNDDWASDQFKTYQKPIFPLYAEGLRNNVFINSESQYEDRYVVTAYLEYHPEFGMCQESATEIIMSVRLADTK
ncbi:unnamed protein product [Commensalibacter communis]|uniref:Phage neck terminator protein gp12-like domain-containing protein n=1 Tax=Commensalibacter communis TaxID=2972786 RepID=A0A9W4TQV8_9PROT|nr:hypothetical protein [Commensalibacter communis]CAI3941767.1 unnamed protein product [Commensalibacter communis]CAI3944864.1 unnamed protein product [Commensalibacter communis]CAI3959071.1 unnamed protein product [Commensalibacter communis]CAI3960987.1 unnamed protein product [Commensalibacter communis]